MGVEELFVLLGRCGLMVGAYQLARWLGLLV
jgi:hypothetical protein